LVGDLDAFLAAQGVQMDSVTDWPRTRSLIEKLSTSAAPQLSAEEVDIVLATLNILTERITSVQGTVAGFWRQVFKCIKTFTQIVTLDTSNWPGLLKAINLRDAAMADNLLWLAREAYAGRKIVVWAQTLHNSRNTSEFITMGHLAWQALGNAIYSVGFSAYEGRTGWATKNEVNELPRPPSDSLEDLWGATPHENAFLDLRRVPAGGEWLQAPLVSRLLGHVPASEDWSQILDAVVFMRTMRPSIRVN
jgi:hypothetical protein